jgi:biopolymer transport protein ExbB
VGQAPFALTDLAGEARIGELFHGQLDEVNLASVARSPAFILAQAASQGADTPMLGFNDDAGASEGGSSTFSILMGAVTFDGWIVIGLLIVMAIVSFYVMISKAIILSAIYKANTLFLAVFKEKSAQLLTPGHAEADVVAVDARLNRSPIKRLYTIGLQEINQRFEAQLAAGRATSLSPASIDAIRAALEAAMLRENQKLNSGIVLLTIAIAGGPFLGLLGTVVGVMITFAAIAAAGDVNVNAIAPGIAAALVATVAGLVVAIPALFGYNWLASQIKNASGDTHVFVDEFLTRSAEVYAV